MLALPSFTDNAKQPDGVRALKQTELYPRGVIIRVLENEHPGTFWVDVDFSEGYEDMARALLCRCFRVGLTEEELAQYVEPILKARAYGLIQHGFPQSANAETPQPVKTPQQSAND